MRYVEGPEKNFPDGCFFFLREDVMKIKHAFEKYGGPVIAYSRPGELVALGHAMKNYLGHGAALAAVIQAVVNGVWVPTGCTSRFRGITGYSFVARDLRKYRPVQGVNAPPDGFINYNETAAVLGVKMRDIRGLVTACFIRDAVEYQFGVSKLLSTADVQRFADSHVAKSKLAKRSDVNTVALVRYLTDRARRFCRSHGRRNRHVTHIFSAKILQLKSRSPGVGC
jgi:hypothetical protein